MQCRCGGEMTRKKYVKGSAGAVFWIYECRCSRIEPDRLEIAGKAVLFGREAQARWLAMEG